MMSNAAAEAEFFASESVPRVLLRIAPPVMAAQLIQSLYNIVDSFFVGQYSTAGLTALSVIAPLQWLLLAFGVGTGVGVNTLMARYYAQKQERKANDAAGCGMVLAVLTWALYALVTALLMRPYVMLQASGEEAVSAGITYGNVIVVGSLGIFLESVWTKVHQARGDMRIPMIAQISGALVNIVLDPVLIFGLEPFPRGGVAGAAIATIIGQCVAAAIVARGGVHRPPALGVMAVYARRIYHFAYASILLQIMWSTYIIFLNIILQGFSDAAVTVLGLYYKLQAFFFIPLFALQGCIVAPLSYNYALEKYDRCRAIIRDACGFAMLGMVAGMICFIGFPHAMVGIFTHDGEVMAIGVPAFRVIGLCFLSAAPSMIMPAFFQAIGSGGYSVLCSLTRHVFCMVPIFWVLSWFGLAWVWWTFSITETVTALTGYVLYRLQLKRWRLKAIGESGT
mgnify:CR=1 FL=1